MAQTTVLQYGAAAYKGMLDSIVDNYVISMSAEGAVPIGFPVVLGTNKERQVVAASTSVGQGALIVSLPSRSRSFLLIALHPHRY